MNKKCTINYSDEDYVSLPKSIFIKRFSNHKDDAYKYALEEYFNKNGFDGVVYSGEKRDDVLFEFVDQTCWEQSVLFKTNYVIIYFSGSDYDFDSDEINDFIDYLDEYDGKHQKLVFYNQPAKFSGSDEDYESLFEIINETVKTINDY